MNLTHNKTCEDKLAPINEDPNTTLDSKLQDISTQALKKGMNADLAKSGTALIIDTKTSAIRALASFKQGPGSNGMNLNLDECNLFTKDGALSALEPGSIMKPLLMATALNTRAVKESDTYYEPGILHIDERNITDVEVVGGQTLTMQDILSLSLNTGAVYVEKQLGDNKLDLKARQVWYDYLTDHYQFGKSTKTGLFNENPGYVRKPNDGPGLEVRYAQMSFGVGLTVTPLQIAAAYSSLVNGGLYKAPYIYNSDTNSPIVNTHAISDETSVTIQHMLVKTFQYNNPDITYPGTIIGAKSGSAPSAKNNGSYNPQLENGTYVGFFGKESPEYIILVRLIEPHTHSIASGEARKIWVDIISQLVKSSYSVGLH